MRDLKTILESEMKLSDFAHKSGLKDLEEALEKRDWNKFCNLIVKLLKKHGEDGTDGKILRPAPKNRYGWMGSTTDCYVRIIGIGKDGKPWMGIQGKGNYDYVLASFDMKTALPLIAAGKDCVSTSGNKVGGWMLKMDVLYEMLLGIEQEIK
jgi:hypothetical protein